MTKQHSAANMSHACAGISDNRFVVSTGAVCLTERLLVRVDSTGISCSSATSLAASRITGALFAAFKLLTTVAGLFMGVAELIPASGAIGAIEKALNTNTIILLNILISNRQTKVSLCKLDAS